VLEVGLKALLAAVVVFDYAAGTFLVWNAFQT
jgi:hypothetical protein